MEERAGERRSVSTKLDASLDLNGLPSPRPSPTPASWEREKISGQCRDTPPSTLPPTVEFL
jgi:hypothetical protein